MALYDTRFGLPQSMVDYLNQGLPDIYQNIYNPPPATIGPGPDEDEGEFLEELYPQNVSSGGDGAFNPYNTNLDSSNIRTQRNYVNPFPYDPMDDFGTSDYGYIEQPKKGIKGLFDQYVKTSIPAQLIGGGVKRLLNLLPVNRTGIMQNELLGAGFALDNIGRIVAAPGKYNTPEGIMAGYNLAAREQDFDDPKNVFNKRTSTIRNTLKNKYGLNDQQIDEALAEIEEEGEYKGPFGYNETLGKTTNLFENLFNINKARNIIEDKQKATDIIFNRKLKERQDPITIADRKSAIDQEASNRDAAREAAKAAAATRSRDLGSMRGGVGRDGGSGPSSGTGRGATSATSSGLGGFGFSDIRLKENVELIGKSPSNINIYKFNYKDNPTTYQGAMAHEVPWASIKHSNGYMMVDYNQIDVDFKKYND